MAIVVVNEMQGGGEELYERINPKVMPNGELPEGCQLHIAGPVEGGWRVITVWDSEPAFEEFRNSKLIPAIREAGDADRVAPNIGTNPVHKLMTR